MLMIIWTLKQETQVGKTWYEISHEPHFQNTMISRRSQFDFNESVQLTLLLSSTLMKYVKIYVHITYAYIYKVVGNWWYKLKGGDFTRKKKSKI